MSNILFLAFFINFKNQISFPLSKLFDPVIHILFHALYIDYSLLLELFNFNNK